MGKLLLLLMIAGAIYGAARHFGYVGSKPGAIELQGSGPGQVLVAGVEGSKVTFTVNGPAKETYMVFGGSAGGSSFSHASFSGIELAAIRRIARRYPDFHRCNSPGAPEAKRMAEDVQVVADRATLATLSVAVKAAAARERAGGERLCATIEGQWLTLEQMEKGELRVTGEQYKRMIPGNATKQYFLHLQSLDARDCKGSI